MIVRRIVAMFISMVLVCALVGPTPAAAMSGSPVIAVHSGSGQSCGKPMQGKGLPGACTTSAACTVQTGVLSAPTLLPQSQTDNAQPYWWTVRTACGTAMPPELGPPRSAI